MQFSLFLPQAVGSGTSPVIMTAQISNLTHYTTYHYRLVATNVAFRSKGTDMVLTTLPAAPVISSFSPMAGPTGTVVTVTGSNLTGASHVWFNGVAAQFTCFQTRSSKLLYLPEQLMAG